MGTFMAKSQANWVLGNKAFGVLINQFPVNWEKREKSLILSQFSLRKTFALPHSRHTVGIIVIPALQVDLCRCKYTPK